MIELTRGTTPTIEVIVDDDVDLSNITATWLYISQKNKVVVDKELSDVVMVPEEHIIRLKLSQDDTLALKKGTAIFQIRIYFPDGLAMATVADDDNVTIHEIYKDGVIHD